MPARSAPATRKRPGHRTTAAEEVVAARAALPALREAIMENPERFGVDPEKVASAQTPEDAAVQTYRTAEKERLQARRVEAMSLRLAGLTWDQIADRLGTSAGTAMDLVNITIARATYSGVDEMRATENARLDRMQAGIWSLAIQGDMKAIGTMLRIQDMRARLNGLYAPTRIDLSVGVRTEMETALSELKMTLLGDTYQADIQDADVVESSPFDDDALDQVLADLDEMDRDYPEYPEADEGRRAS